MRANSRITAYSEVVSRKGPNNFLRIRDCKREGKFRLTNQHLFKGV
jgi:hypothetical protein